MQMCTCSCQKHNIRKYSRGVNGWSVFQENLSSEPSDTNTKMGLQARIHERFTDHTNPLWYVKAQWRPLPPLKISIIAAFVTFLKVLPAISRSGSERRHVFTFWKLHRRTVSCSGSRSAFHYQILLHNSQSVRGRQQIWVETLDEEMRVAGCRAAIRSGNAPIIPLLPTVHLQQLHLLKFWN